MTYTNIAKLLSKAMLAKQMAVGKAEEAKAIAIEMKKDGMSISQIVKFTKLSEAEIEKL